MNSWLHAVIQGGLTAFNIYNGVVNGNKWSLIIALPLTGVLFILFLTRAIVETAKKAQVGEDG